jgi:Ser/Thr protein kinase RdoA (MazF antagonist)
VASSDAGPGPGDRARRFAGTRGYSIESTLGENPRKATGVYLATKRGGHFVIKCAAEGAPPDALVALRAESGFYREHACPALAPYVESAEGVLVTGHVPGVPLRRLLAAGAADERALGEALARVRAALDVLYESCRAAGGAGTTDVAFRHLRSLVRSGPRGAPRPGAARRLAGRFAEWRLRPRLARAMSGPPAFAAPGFSHGDLHYDNVLVDLAGGSVHFVDFERHDRSSPFDLDLMYLLAMTEKALSRRPVLRDRWLGAFAGMLELPAWKETCAIFRAAAAVNPRFSD